MAKVVFSGGCQIFSDKHPVPAGGVPPSLTNWSSLGAVGRDPLAFAEGTVAARSRPARGTLPSLLTGGSGTRKRGCVADGDLTGSVARRICGSAVPSSTNPEVPSLSLRPVPVPGRLPSWAVGVIRPGALLPLRCRPSRVVSIGGGCEFLHCSRNARTTLGGSVAWLSSWPST